MGRLIDADVLIKEIAGQITYRSGAEPFGFNNGLEAACKVVEAQPTIAERTAQELNPFDDELPYCSECKKEITGDGYNYCPNCGARFKEAVNEMPCM